MPSFERDLRQLFLAVSDNDEPTILYAEIDPERARNKHLVNMPGK